MKSSILKKGKTAVAWAVSLAMVFATVSYPVSVAKADTSSSLNFTTITKDEVLADTDLDTEGIQLVLPEGTNFIFIKQANSGGGQSVVWTLEPLTTDADKQAILDYVIGQPGAADDDATLANTMFISGFDTFDFTPPQGDDYWYTFSEGPEGTIILSFPDGKISHIWYGNYEVPENPTVPVSFLKVLKGMDLEEGMFSFILTETDDEWEPLTEGYTETVTNDEDGNVVFTDLEFEEAGTYYYTIKEVVPAEPAEGMLYDEHVVKLTVTVTGEEVLEAEAVFDGLKTFTNTYEEEELGEITVVKTVSFPENEAPKTFNKDFYITLFVVDDDDLVPVGTQMVSFSGKYDPDAEQSVTFKGLELDETYVIYETDGANFPNDSEENIIDPDEDLPMGDWMNILYKTQEIELNADETTGEASITNVYDPEDFALEGSIIVKKTVTKNGELWATPKKFYVALFVDEELTQRVTDPKLIDMAGSAKAEVEFTSADIDEEYQLPEIVFYIAETDSEGEAITDSLAKFGFEIEQDTTMVAIEDILADEVIVNLINKYKEEEFPVTGDSTNMNLWLFLAVLGVAGAIAPFALRKREEIND